MVSYKDKLRKSQLATYISPVVEKLQGVFDSIDDAELVEALTGNKKRRCKGYPAKALWRSFLATYVLDIKGVAALVRQLEANPYLCQVCGIDPLVIPHESTYSRFISEQLSQHNDFVEKVLLDAVNVLKEHLDDFGKILAVDSTDIHAYSKGVKNNSEKRATDPDATWGSKKKNGGPYFWFGYKVHMVCDATHELPVAVTVTTAKESDYRNFIPPLERTNIKPEIVTADAGYDAGYNYEFTVDELDAIPVIDLNKRGNKKGGKTSHRTKAERRILDIRDFPGIARSTQEWKDVYDKRTSVERLFSRAKALRRLDNVRYRGIRKVTLHALLSTLSIVATAIVSLYSDESIRKVA